MIAFETTLACTLTTSQQFLEGLGAFRFVLKFLRLQVSVGNLMLEFSTRCVRMVGVETQVVRVLYV